MQEKECSINTLLSQTEHVVCAFHKHCPLATDELSIMNHMHLYTRWRIIRVDGALGSTFRFDLKSLDRQSERKRARQTEKARPSIVHKSTALKDRSKCAKCYRL